MSIQWEYPEPRTGFDGVLDRFIGPGATRAEIALQISFPIITTVLILFHAATANLGWNALQYIVAAILALDMAGGIVTNATSAAKRWYHRKEQGLRQHLIFIAVHAVQIFLVAWQFRALDWAYFVVIYAYLLGAAYLILRVPLYLQRPLAFGFAALGILVGLYGFTATVGMEWFLPFLFLKLLLSHLIHEEPYAPPPNN